MFLTLCDGIRHGRTRIAEHEIILSNRKASQCATSMRRRDGCLVFLVDFDNSRAYPGTTAFKAYGLSETRTQYVFPVHLDICWHSMAPPLDHLCFPGTAAPASTSPRTLPSSLGRFCALQHAVIDRNSSSMLLKSIRSVLPLLPKLTSQQRSHTWQHFVCLCVLSVCTRAVAAIISAVSGGRIVE